VPGFESVRDKGLNLIDASDLLTLQVNPATHVSSN